MIYLATFVYQFSLAFPTKKERDRPPSPIRFACFSLKLTLKRVKHWYLNKPEDVVRLQGHSQELEKGGAE